MLKDIIRIFPADSWNTFRFRRAEPVDNFFAPSEKRSFSSLIYAIFVIDIPLETVPERVVSPDLASGGCRPLSLNPKNL